MGLIETCSVAVEEPQNCTVKANLTVDDILKLPAFVTRNKNKKKTVNAPTKTKQRRREDKKGK